MRSGLAFTTFTTFDFYLFSAVAREQKFRAGIFGMIDVVVKINLIIGRFLLFICWSQSLSIFSSSRCSEQNIDEK